MNTTELTSTQRAVLELATHTQGRLEAFPATLHGGARTNVLHALERLGMIQTTDAGTTLTPAGYATIDCTPPSAPTHAPRAGCKQAVMLALLQRAEGATLAELCAATGWQAHSVRGTLSRAFKHKRGLIVISEKPHGRERIYRIAP